MKDIKYLKKLSNELRADALSTILKANSGHLGACSSSAELMTGLYFGDILKFNLRNPYDTNRDMVYVRGHLGPLRYSIFSKLGWINPEELGTYRQIGSILKGHEDMEHCPGVDMTPSGSLGMGLSYGVGAAIMTKKQGKPSRHYVFLGDGEEQEGSVSEAARHAANMGLDNLVCILDKNKKQLSRPTFENDGVANIKKIWEGYGWDVHEIQDGHDFEQIIPAYEKLKNAKKQTLLIANTIKGKSIKGATEHFNGYHTISSCKDKEVIEFSIKECRLKTGKSEQESNKKATRNFTKPNKEVFKYDVSIGVNPKNNINLDHSQVDYFQGLEKVVRDQGMPFFFMTPDFLNKNVVSLCNLDKSSTFIDTGIREQHLVSTSYAMSKIDPNARMFLNYGDAFLYRAADQLNAAAQGKSNLIFMSEMSGLSQHQNGTTHQSSGQPSIPLFMPGVKFYEPADVQDLFNVLNHTFSNNDGLNLIRSHRADINPLEVKQDARNISNYIAFESMKSPEVSLVGTGFVLGEMIEAAKKLETDCGIGSRVVNVINMKDIEEDFVRKLVPERPVLTVYNGNPEILQSSVTRAIMEDGSGAERPSIVKGHGFYFGDTGKLNDLIEKYKLNSEGIIDVLKSKKLIK